MKWDKMSDKDKWIKDVSRLMNNRQVQAPEGLLKAVKKESAVREQLARKPMAHPIAAGAHTFPLRVRRWATAAAIVVAIALPVAFSLLHQHQDEMAVADQAHPTRIKTGKTADLTSPQQGKFLMTGFSGRPRTEATYHLHSVDAYSSLPTDTTATRIERSLISEGVGAGLVSPQSSIKKESNAQPDATYPPSVSEHHVSASTRRAGTLMLTAYCGGLGSGQRNGVGMSTGIMMADAAPYGLTSLEMASVSQRNGLVAVDRRRMKAHHAQPVKVGMSVGYALSDRWTIRTGLTYSYLSSDFTTEGELTQTQRLHYVGMPVSASYTLLRSQKAEVYATAGGEVEKLVKGTVSSVNRKNEKVNEKRPQFSMTGAIGGAYHFTPSLSVYAEPGVSYYFDNHSNVMNVYKDRPTSFSLNVGLRITIK